MYLGPILPVYDGRESLYTIEPIPSVEDKENLELQVKYNIFYLIIMILNFGKIVISPFLNNKESFKFKNQ